MLDARFRPLLKWTRKPDLARERDAFVTKYPATLDKLEYELRKLNATDIFIEAGFSLQQLRNDGWPQLGSTLAHPGVVLYFTIADGAMVFPCGTYARFAANMHAIALTLEKLRAIDRYGVTLGGHQQYLGFAALPSPPKQWSVEQAAEFIATEDGQNTAEWRGAIVKDPEIYRFAYRRCAAKLHPDVAKNNDGFYKLSQAKVILDQHHGLAKAGGA